MITASSVLRKSLAVLAASGTVATGVIAGAGAAQAAVPPTCHDSSLQVSHTPADGAAGSSSFVLEFRNVGGRTCSLDGYPGLDALNAHGRVLAHATRTSVGGSPHAVSIAPGATASARVIWANFNTSTSGDCTFGKLIAVTPPNTTKPSFFAAAVSICSLRIWVVQAGTSGNPNFVRAGTQWRAGSHANAATQGAFWAKARKDLLGKGDQWTEQAAQLKQLIALPNTNLTSAQQKTYKRDVTALDAFFCTPGLYL